MICLPLTGGFIRSVIKTGTKNKIKKIIENVFFCIASILWLESIKS